MNARQLGDRVDEADIRSRPPRRTHPRTKDRPQHTDAGYGGVIAVDRGRFTCLVAAPGAVPASLADLAPGGRRSPP